MLQHQCPHVPALSTAWHHAKLSRKQPKHPVPQFPHLHLMSPWLWMVAPRFLPVPCPMCTKKVPSVGLLPFKRHQELDSLCLASARATSCWALLDTCHSCICRAGGGSAPPYCTWTGVAGDSTHITLGRSRLVLPPEPCKAEGDSPESAPSSTQGHSRAGHSCDAGLGFGATSPSPAPAEDVAGTRQGPLGHQREKPLRGTSQRSQMLGADHSTTQASKPGRTNPAHFGALPNPHPGRGAEPPAVTSGRVGLSPKLTPRPGDARSSFLPRWSLIRT